MDDPVNHPPHYGGQVECIDAIESIGIGPEFCRGNAIEYLWRLGRKGNALEDARKAQWYLNRLIQQLEGEPQPDPEVMRRSMEDVKAGRSRPMQEFVDELRAEPDDEWDEINNPAHYALGYLAAGYMDMFTDRASNVRHRLRTVELLGSVLSQTAIVELARACRSQYRANSNDKELLPWE